MPDILGAIEILGKDDLTSGACLMNVTIFWSEIGGCPECCFLKGKWDDHILVSEPRTLVTNVKNNLWKSHSRLPLVSFVRHY